MFAVYRLFYKTFERLSAASDNPANVKEEMKEIMIANIMEER